MKQGNRREFTRSVRQRAAIAAFLCLFLAACSFNYDDTSSQSSDAPNMIMEDVEYVRMTRGNPEVRLRAEEVRRYEEKHTMELDGFSFEQYNAAPEGEEQIPDINAQGTAGKARMETDTNNVFISGDVSIEVVSEDMTIETPELSWQNEERRLSAPGLVNIVQPDGTTLRGTGFSADVRRRSWTFESTVEGAVVEDDEEDGEAAEPGEDSGGEETADANNEAPTEVPAPEAASPVLEEAPVLEVASPALEEVPAAETPILEETIDAPTEATEAVPEETP